jgi:hypothetical protein
MKTGALMKLPEGQLDRHSDLNLIWVSVRQLAVDPSSPFQINDGQDVGQIEGKDGPVVKAVGEQFPFLVRDPYLFKLAFGLTPHANPLRRELDVPAGNAFVASPPDQGFLITPHDRSG